MLFSFFDDMINNLVSSILGQFNYLTDQVTTPLRGLVDQVTGGIWLGNGANKFVAEMTSQIIPMVASILTGTQNYSSAIKKSQEHMLQGFQQAASVAQDLFDTFGSIF
jgi:uncharacterized phage infection (PIP) family protein YhgE